MKANTINIYFTKNYCQVCSKFRFMFAIFACTSFLNVTYTFAKQSPEPYFPRYNVYVDAINQLFRDVHEFKCVSKFDENYQDNEDFCDQINKDGVMLFNISKSITSHDSIDRETILNALPDIRQLNDCIKNGCGPYNVINVEKRTFLSDNFSKALHHLECILQVNPGSYAKRSTRFYKVVFDHNSKARFDNTINSIPSDIHARYGAFLFMSNDQFEECKYLKTPKPSLQILGRLSVRNLFRHTQ